MNERTQSEKRTPQIRTGREFVARRLISRRPQAEVNDSEEIERAKTSTVAGQPETRDVFK